MKMKKENENTVTDIDYADRAVDTAGRRGFCHDVYDYAGIHIFLSKYVGWSADGCRT